MSNLPVETEFRFYASVVRENLKKAKRDLMDSPPIQIIETHKTVVEGLKALTTYFDGVTDNKKREEFKQILNDLMLDFLQTEKKLTEVHDKLITELEENRKLRNQVENLREEVAKISSVDAKLTIGQDGMYYDSENNGPFCIDCYDSKKQKSRVVRTMNPSFGKL